MTSLTDRRAPVFPSEERLLNIWRRIDQRNKQLGWSRYDWSDLESHPWLLNGGAGLGGRALRYGVRGLDMLAPLLVHRLLRMTPRIIPTAFYHTGMAYLVRNRLADREPISRSEIEAVCRAALEQRLDAPSVCWAHPYPHHAASWKVSKDDVRPASCAHHTARVGELLLRAGLELNENEFVQAGISAANALMTYHNWSQSGESGWTVSYYPFTEDETINTATDVAALFGLVPRRERTDLMQARLEGIVRMALAEQQADGSWYYCTRRHYSRLGGKPFIDNHHSAQVVQALAKLCVEGGLPADLRSETLAAVRSGLRFYITSFFDAAGRGFYFAGEASRETPVVGYSEGIAALYWALKSGAITDAAETDRIRMLSERMLERALKLMHPGTGDVACTRVLGRYYHLQSLRWGSGPLMEAISYALLLSKEARRDG